MMKKFRILWMLGILVMLLSGCVPAPPQNAAEEIRQHHWIPQTAEGVLYFEGHTLQMDVRQDGQAIHLAGEYFVDGDTLTVLSDDYGVVVLQYTLVNNELRLTYFDKQAIFVKQEGLTETSREDSCAK